jgi:DNA polymerase
MVAKVRGAEAYVPLERSLESMRAAVQDCRGCELYMDATQAVFGEGPASGVDMMLVGEQPLQSSSSLMARSA